jgi:hypothetical protein
MFISLKVVASPCFRRLQTLNTLKFNTTYSHTYHSDVESVMAVRNVHLTGIVKVVPLLVCAMSASISLTP